MTGLIVPDVTGLEPVKAGIAYAQAGWYLAPVRRGTKNPGSVLGHGWQHQTSRDPQQVADWLIMSGHGIALHCGRSGAISFDIDHPASTPAILAQAIGDLKPPFQSSRPGQPDRGHAVFACPPGHMYGNSTGRLGKGWGEVRCANGVILAQPTHHPDNGRYHWEHHGPVPHLPAELAELLDDAQPAADAATDEQVSQFITTHLQGTRPRLLAGPVTRFRNMISAGASRHESAVESTIWAAKEARAGYYPATLAFDAIGEAFRQSLNGTPGRDPAEEYQAIIAWCTAQARAADLNEVRRIAERNDPGDSPLIQLAGFIATLRTWLELPDPAHVLLTLAAAVTRDLDEEPVWLLLVAVPSSGKTETVKLLDKRADGHLNEVTAAGLLGWTKGKEARPAGVLSRIGDRGLVTFGDLSSLLATSDGGGRDATFGLLRRAYDGHVTRDLSPPGKPAPGIGDQLSWRGRLTVIGAVTGAIDRYSVHADQLGARWLYVRIAEPDTAAKRRAADRARKGGLEEYRRDARKIADEIVLTAAKQIPGEVPDAIFAVISESALVTCWGRGAVPRHGYGRREIDGVPVVESPPRVVRQLTGIARGLLALGLPDNFVASLVRRVALDSMPEDRRAVLAALATGEMHTTSSLARAAGLDRKVARMRAEELELIGVVRGVRDGDDHEDEVDRRPVTWQLHGDDGEVIAEVFADHAEAKGWDEIMLTHTPPPPDQQDHQEGDGGTHNFVPPSQPRGRHIRRPAPLFQQPGGRS